MNIPLFFPYRSEAIEEKVIEVLRSGFIATGPYVERFAKHFSSIIEQQNVVTTNDVSNAVQMALYLSDVQPGDEVIATPFSCMSSTAPIGLARAKVRWADMHPETASINIESLERLVSKKTKAMLIYHVAGYPAPILEIAELCRTHNIKLIEDCNSALNATYAGEKVGHFSDFSVFSFYPNRQINAGEGGALVCKSSEDADRAIKLRRYGIDLKTFRRSDGEINPKSDIPEIGWGATLNNLCSAMGEVQLETVNNRIDKARLIARFYFGHIREITLIKPVRPLPKANPSYWVYMIRSTKRDELSVYLKELGIACSKLHQLNTGYSGFDAGEIHVPGAVHFMNEVLCIPCGWWMTDDQARYIVTKLNEFR